jgi:aspartate racemase
MRPKSIGVIGGAGPLAGVLLVERLFQCAMTLYGCHKDESFPLLRLCSFPFSDMLSPDLKKERVEAELKTCLEELLKTSDVIGIGCHTLHAFLDEKQNIPGLIHLPKLVKEALSLNETPVVFCTSTSLKTALHQKFIPCTFPDKKTQKLIDDLIDAILKKGCLPSLEEELKTLLKSQKGETIILGCTELSLFSKRLFIEDKRIIDPLDLLAKKMIEKSFSQ